MLRVIGFPLLEQRVDHPLESRVAADAVGLVTAPS
jgi:hypothetical protein